MEPQTAFLAHGVEQLGNGQLKIDRLGIDSLQVGQFPFEYQYTFLASLELSEAEKKDCQPFKVAFFGPDGNCVALIKSSIDPEVFKKFPAWFNTFQIIVDVQATLNEPGIYEAWLVVNEIGIARARLRVFLKDAP